MRAVNTWELLLKKKQNNFSLVYTLIFSAEKHRTWNIYGIIWFFPAKPNNLKISGRKFYFKKIFLKYVLWNSRRRLQPFLFFSLFITEIFALDFFEIHLLKVITFLWFLLNIFYSLQDADTIKKLTQKKEFSQKKLHLAFFFFPFKKSRLDVKSSNEIW